MTNLDNIFNLPVIGVAADNINMPVEKRKSRRSAKEVFTQLENIKKSKKSDPLSNTINKNTHPYNENFPSLEGLPEPSQGSVPEGTTGTGRGGNIVTKTYSKTSSINNILNNAAFNINASNLQDIEAANNTTPSIVNKIISKYKNSNFNLDKILNNLSANYGNKGPVISSSLIGTTLGALGGLGLSTAKSLGEAKNPNYKKNALIGSIIGTLLGAGYGYNHAFNYKQKHKYAFIKKAFSLPIFSPLGGNSTFNSTGGVNNISTMFNNITNKIMSDYNLNINQKYELVSYIKEQPSSIIKDLNRIVNSVTGAGIGYLISNYLLGMGKRGNIVLSILGGIIGNSLTSNKNSLFSLPTNYTTPAGDYL